MFKIKYSFWEKKEGIDINNKFYQKKKALNYLKIKDNILCWVWPKIINYNLFLKIFLSSNHKNYKYANLKSFNKRILLFLRNNSSAKTIQFTSVHSIDYFSKKAKILNVTCFFMVVQKSFSATKVWPIILSVFEG